MRLMKTTLKEEREVGREEGIEKGCYEVGIEKGRE